MRGVDGEFGFSIFELLRTRTVPGRLLLRRPRSSRNPTACGPARKPGDRTPPPSGDGPIGLARSAPTSGAASRVRCPVRRAVTTTGTSCCRLNDAVMRNYNIVTQRHTRISEEAATSPTTGQPIRIIFVDDNAAAGGDGSTEAPFNTLRAKLKRVRSRRHHLRAVRHLRRSIDRSEDRPTVPRRRRSGPGRGRPVPRGRLHHRRGPVPRRLPAAGLPQSGGPADHPQRPGRRRSRSLRGTKSAASTSSGRADRRIAGDGGQSFNIHDLTIAQSGGAGINLVELHRHRIDPQRRLDAERRVRASSSPTTPARSRWTSAA